MTLQERVEAACKADPGIVASIDTIQKHPGRPEEYFQDVLGLSRKDLKKLEKQGLAVRGYAPIKTGIRVMWILFVPGGENGR
jgi:hypothetical protein